MSFLYDERVKNTFLFCFNIQWMVKNYKIRIDSYAYEIGMDLVSDIAIGRWGWAGEKSHI